MFYRTRLPGQSKRKENVATLPFSVTMASGHRGDGVSKALRDIGLGSAQITGTTYSLEPMSTFSTLVQARSKKAILPVFS